METDPKAAAAREALGTTMTLAVQQSCVIAAVRALIAAHPDPVRVRQVFDQLLFQTRVHPAVLADKDRAIVLDDLTETLFEPAVQLRIDP